MISFTCDYSEGAHPAILEKLALTNMIQAPGYGEDGFCAAAIEKIRTAVGKPSAKVFFLVGGTQTNSTVIDAMLAGHEGVIAAESGHIAVHEAGAIEFSGHKVITLPGHKGKINAGELKAWLQNFHGDGAWLHMVYPAMVYISFPSEYGTLYSKAEIAAIREICREYKMKLFVDGARLGYGLASPECDLTLPELAELCDVFYIGGTKVGALCGEAVVFPEPETAPAAFFTIIKQHGALLAKGRLLGIQFDALFSDGLYMNISRSAIEKAMRVKSMFQKKGIPFHIDSPTNQQFPILTKSQIDSLKDKVMFEIWEKLPGGRSVTRFATSWATTEAQLDELESYISNL
ncbi:MAG: low specificity L-threonine aldolase [Bacteroidales bacterium]|nr:low specificity L-threonine aldolase [Bacteroidales bacterium]